MCTDISLLRFYFGNEKYLSSHCSNNLLDLSGEYVVSYLGVMICPLTTIAIKLKRVLLRRERFILPAIWNYNCNMLLERVQRNTDFFMF